jgi:hypothetical protein
MPELGEAEQLLQRLPEEIQNREGLRQVQNSWPLTADPEMS